VEYIFYRSRSEVTKIKLSSEQNIWIFSHSHTSNGKRSSLSGPVKFLLEYFLPRARTVVLHEQPMPSSQHLLPTLEIYQDGKLILQRTFPAALLNWWLPRRPRPEKTYIRLKLRDLLSSAYFSWIALRYSPRADLFLGVECLNALWGVLMKSINRASYPVYYLFDFSPGRYPSQLFNRIYLWLDKRASYSCTATWNISVAMEEARIKLGYSREKMARQLTVPYGLQFQVDSNKANPPGKKVTLVYAGGINHENGVMLIPGVVKRLRDTRPGVELVVMGAGSQEEEFLRRIRDLGLEKDVVWKGYLAPGQVFRELSRSHIALAPYYPMESTKKYGDVIKIKTYLSAGLPTITTEVPPISADIRRLSMGVVVPYDEDQWVMAIDKLLDDPARYALCRSRALEFVRGQTWENILNRAVEETR